MSSSDVRIVPVNPVQQNPTAGVEITFDEACIRQGMSLNTIWATDNGEFIGSNTSADLHSKGMLPFPKNAVAGEKQRILFFRPASLAEINAARSKYAGFWVELGRGLGALEIPLVESVFGYQQLGKAEQACASTFSDADWATDPTAVSQFAEAWLKGRLTSLFASYQQVKLGVKMMDFIITPDMLCGSGGLGKACMFLKVSIQMNVEPVLLGLGQRDALV